MKKLLQKLGNKLAYILIGFILAMAGTVYAVNITVPNSNVQGSIPIGNANPPGTYTNGNLVPGTNITITTSTPGQITISSTGGSSSITTSTPAQIGKVAVWTGLATLGNGSLWDNGTVAGVNATSSTVAFNIQGTSAIDPFQVGTSTNTSMLIVKGNTGNVGIGTSTPPYTLTISKTNSTNAVGSSALVIDNPGGTASLLSFNFAGSTKSWLRTDNNGNMVFNASSGNFYLNADQGGASTVNSAADMNLYTPGANVFRMYGGGLSGGAGAQFFGNSSSFPGQLYLDGGTVSGSDIIFRTGVSTTERMRVLSTGRIGIGTSTPWATLTVQDIATSTAATTTAAFDVASSSGASYLWVAHNGNVGISTSVPGSRLSLQGTAGSTTRLLNMASSSGLSLLTVLSNGDVGIGTSSPTSGVNIVGKTLRVSDNEPGVVPAADPLNGGLAISTNVRSAAEVNFFNLKPVTTDTQSYSWDQIVSGGSTVQLMKLNLFNSNTGAQLQLTTGGPSSIGGTDGSVWIAFVASAGNYFSNSVTNDIAYRNTSGRLLFGNTSGNASVAISNDRLGVGTVTPGSILAVQGVAGATTNLVTVASSSGASLLTVLGNGSIGIGSSTPIATLSVKGAGGTNPFVVSSSTDTQLLTLTQAGRFGIGSSTPNYGFVANGTVAAPNLTTSAGLQTGVVCVGAGGELINDSVACLASARRYKTNIQNLNVGLDEVLRFQPVSFNWTKEFNKGFENDPNKNGVQYSLIADDVQKIDSKMATVEKNGKVHGLADLNHWVALFVQSFKDMENQIVGIMFRQNALEAKVQKQQQQLDKQQHDIDYLKGQINDLKKGK